MSTHGEQIDISGFGNVTLIGSQPIHHGSGIAGAHAFRLDLLQDSDYDRALEVVAEHPQHIDSSLTARILAVRTAIENANPGHVKKELDRHQSELLGYLADCAFTYTDLHDLDPASRLNLNVDYRDIPRRHTGRHSYRTQQS